MIKKTILWLSLMLVISILTPIKSQVTIGSIEKPISGALLDLKEKADGSSSKGMSLPRVKLTSVDSLMPMFKSISDYEDGIKKAEYDLAHTGLLVYNIGTGDVDLCLGIYIWANGKWSRIPEPCNQSAWSGYELTFYKSALAPKSITLDLSLNEATVSWQDDPMAPIAWQMGGFPGLSRKQTKTFVFHPVPNASGSDLVSNVTATINSGGKSETQTITINHLDREMTFATPATLLPAVGAEHDLSINSEAKWTASIANNPGSMITSYPVAEQEASSTCNFKVNIADNTTWQIRAAKFNITSSNPDFKACNFEVKQNFVAPHLTLMHPVSRELHFGTSSAAQHITFKTNAGWASNPAANWTELIASWIPGLGGTSTGSTNALVDVDQQIEVIPTTAVVGFGAAGSEVSTTVNLETKNHPGATSPTATTITLKRTIPAAFTHKSNDPAWGAITLNRTGHNVTVTATTNQWWRAHASTGDVKDMAAGPYGDKSQTITFAANDTWDTRLVDAYVSIDGTNYSRVSQYWQHGYTLNYNGWNNFPNPIPRTGLTDGWYHFGTYSEVGSDCPNFPVRALYSNDLSATESAYGGVGNRSVGVAAWNWWGDRTVHFQYARMGKEWVGAFDIIQKGYDLNFGQGNLVDRLPWDARWQYYTNTWSTNGCPNFRTLVSTGIDGNGQPAGDVWADSNYEHNVGNRAFNIQDNVNNADRVLYFWVEKAGLKWELVSSRVQAGQIWWGGTGDWGEPYWIDTEPMITTGYTLRQLLSGEACAHQKGAGWVNVHMGVIRSLQAQNITTSLAAFNRFGMLGDLCKDYGLISVSPIKDGGHGSAISPWTIWQSYSCRQVNYYSEDDVSQHQDNRFRCMKAK